MKQDISNHLINIINIEKKAGNEQEINFSINLPSADYIQIGMILGYSEKDSAFVVKSISPNSPAERAGIMVNDLIHAINGIKISTLKTPAERKAQWSLKPNQTLLLDITSEKVNKKTTFDIPGVTLPSMNISFNSIKTEGCGSINVGMFPPAEFGLAGVKVRKINQINKDPIHNIHSLPSGDNVIQFSLGNLNNGVTWQGPQKALKLNVKPNTQYFIAAKATRKNQDPKDSKFWEPIVWNSKKVTCY